MLAVACSSNLVTPPRSAPQRSHHDGQIPLPNQALARSRNLVTQAGCGAWRGHSRDARRARPARERHARGRGSTRRSRVEPTRRLGWRPCLRADSPWPSNTVDAHGCEGRDRKTVRNTSTCAVRVAPWRLLDRVEQTSPIGRAHTPQAQFEEDGHQPRRRRVKDADQKKTQGEEDAPSHRPKKARFGSSLTLEDRTGSLRLHEGDPCLLDRSTGPPFARGGRLWFAQRGGVSRARACKASSRAWQFSRWSLTRPMACMKA